MAVVVRVLVPLLLLLAAVSVTGTTVSADVTCQPARVRKPWDSYTMVEKRRYINAVSLAMQLGYHQKFVELHTETQSELEAHRNCMFMYWHRMFLLGYENMLRSLDKEFERLTIPYWDHLSATARAASGQCVYMEDCSPIYKALGGSTTGKDVDLIVYSTRVRDTSETRCITEPPLDNFCGNNSECAGCVLRGPVSRTPYPAEATFASVYQQLFSYSDWPSFSTTIERGVHNMIHNALGGMMLYLQSPTDPIFYSHHGFIDLLQTIYLKCQLGDETAMLTAEQKGSDPRVWSDCARRDSGNFSNTDEISMWTRDFGRNWVNVRTSPQNILYPFFKDLPGRFSDYVDTRDLRDYSYTYQMQGALTNLYTNCDQSNTMASAMLLSDEVLAARNQQASNTSELLPVLNGPTATDTKFRLWTIAIYESAKLAGYTDDAARDQMELMLCVHSDECLGGVRDYDDVFRENFGVAGHPRCFTLLDQLSSGKKIIGVPGWRDISSKFLSCPIPELGSQENARTSSYMSVA